MSLDNEAKIRKFQSLNIDTSAVRCKFRREVQNEDEHFMNVSTVGAVILSLEKRKKRIVSTTIQNTEHFIHLPIYLTHFDL